MKKMIYAALFIAVPIICFSQEKAKEPIVFKDKTGIIQAVEFPDSIKSSNIPSSTDAFFKDFLKWFGPLKIGLFYRRLNIHKNFDLILT